MKGWRSSLRRSSPFQPRLPGLLDSSEKVSRRVASPAEFALHRARTRLLVAAALFGIVYSVIAGRLTMLSLMSDASENAPSSVASGDATTTSRADIVDRNGTVLATSLPLFSLCADARKVIDPDDAARKLLSVLPDLDRDRLAENLHGSKHCVVLKRHLTPRQYYAINKMGIAGLEFNPDEGRTYPAGNVTAHVLGYTDIDNKGIAGLERSLNARLQEKPEPVVTTLDLRLQTIMRGALSDAIQNFHALGGAGIVMDTTNGEILALVSLPDFDPMHAGNADDNALFNRATLGVYEMGSTFKIFNTALALDSGLVKVGERFDTTHPLEVGRRKIHDFHPSDHDLNVAEIFMESSNIGSARMAMRFGSARQRAFLEHLGLLEKTPLELPEIGMPLAPSASNWGDAATMTVAFGHGVSVNAVQLVSAAATIVNDGLTVKPTLLKKDGPSVKTTQDRLVSPRTAALMRALMRLVVTHGTAKQADVEGYVVGGKTGTADKLSGRTYSANARLSSFLGVFPLNAPRYIVFALLDDPKGNAKTHGFATGGWTAAPVVGKVIAQIGPLLGLSPMEQDKMAATERDILKPLGPDLLESLNVTAEDDDASVEVDSDH